MLGVTPQNLNRAIKMGTLSPSYRLGPVDRFKRTTLTNASAELAATDKHQAAGAATPIRPLRLA